MVMLKVKEKGKKIEGRRKATKKKKKTELKVVGVERTQKKIKERKTHQLMGKKVQQITMVNQTTT